MTTEMVRAGNNSADERVVESLVLRGDGSDDSDPSGSRTKKARAQLDAAVKTAEAPAESTSAQPQAPAKRVA